MICLKRMMLECEAEKKNILMSMWKAGGEKRL